MDKRSGYSQFCPVAMAAEIVCARWTALVLRELIAGSRRFNDIKRGVPRMSPSLLSKRLKELEAAGIVEGRRAEGATVTEYHLTEAGEDLKSVIMPLGTWGQRWVETQLSLRNLDPSLLMWDMRRNLKPVPIPDRRCTIQFEYPELPSAKRRWWLVVEAGGTDLCLVDPGYDIDLHVRCPLKSMTAIWMGHASVKGEIEAGRLELIGERTLAQSMQTWLGLSPFAVEKNRRATA
ncbi:MAG TPA: helix-turn-helix domain-containing protein [Aestuariivirgaceae bacterium]|nr:helix-turn-helix domain-containing protein [Aestuariivirgaceae bacterium]